jgi:PAS domain S-box-containing protein
VPGSDRVQSEKLWQSFVESFPDLVMVVDPEGTILFTNHVRRVFAGRQIIGAKLWEFAAGDAESRLRGKLRQILQTQAAVRYEAPGYSDAGAAWYESCGIPVVVDGEVQCIIWCARDVTERRVALERLTASEKRVRAMVEHGSDCIAIMDEQGVIRYASPALLQSLGYDAEEMLGHQGGEFVHPDDLEASGLSAPPGTKVDSVIRLRHKDGSWRWQEGAGVNLLHDPDLRAWFCNRRDVTERKREEERLAFQAAIVAQVNEAVLAVRGDHVIQYWNDAATSLFGWTAEEAVGKRSVDLFHPRYLNPGGYEVMSAAVLGSGKWRGEVALTTKSGDEVIVESSVHYLRDWQTGICVMKDITANRRLEEQLRQSQKMEAIGLLAGGVAHDFNNLLAVILGCTEIATHKLPPGHPVAELLSEVTDAARRGADLTRKLLAFSRKELIQPRAIDVRSTVDDFTRMLERVLGADVELVVEHGRGPIVVRRDAVQLEQVLLNLCTNARQAMPDGGRLRLATRAVSFDEAFVARHPWSKVGAFAEIVVSDSGVGMDEATRAHAFEPFFTTKALGTGLGLSTVYGIVQQHGGFIHVESAPTAGTTFHILLPQCSDSALQPSIPAPPSDDVMRGKETILLAEDESSLRTLVAQMLSELGYRVIATGDGEEAVRVYAERANEIALVVMDVVMPRLGARDAYERMRAVRPGVKVLFTTGYAPQATRLGELLDGSGTPLAVLEKPFTAQALATMVRSAIDGTV